MTGTPDELLDHMPPEQFDSARAATEVALEKASVPNPRSGSKTGKAHDKEIEENMYGGAMFDVPAPRRRRRG